MVAVASLLAAVGGGAAAAAAAAADGGGAGWDSLYWRLALSLTTREQRELGIKLRSAVISSEWDQYPHVLAAAFILSVFIRVAKRSRVIFPAAQMVN